MAHFMFRWKLSEASVKALVAHPQNRTDAARTLIESCGGKLESYYFCLGEYDGLGIAAFHSAVHAAGCAMKAAATGAFTRFETVALLSAVEAEHAMQHAHDNQSAYKAPNA